MARPPKLVDPSQSPVHAFARIIIDGRQALGWPRGELAQAINFGATYIGEVERAEKLPPLDVALSLAEALGLDDDAVRRAWTEANNHAQGIRLGSSMKPAPTEESLSVQEPSSPTRGSRSRTSRRALLLGALAMLVLVTTTFLVARSASGPPRAQNRAGSASTSPSTGSPSTTTLVPTTVTSLSARVSRDDFAQRNGWFEADNDKVVATYTDGQYRLLVRQLGSEYYVREPSSSSAASQKVEVDVQRITPARSTYGVSCRMGPSGSTGRPSHYAAAISATGYWSVLRYEGGESLSPIVIAEAAERSQSSDAIRPDGVNRVALECLGGGAAGVPVVLRFSVNGVRLVEVTDPGGLGPGSVGLVVSAYSEPVEVRFDNFQRTVL